jgi:hypothetical protein
LRLSARVQRSRVGALRAVRQRENLTLTRQKNCQVLPKPRPTARKPAAKLREKFTKVAEKADRRVKTSCRYLKRVETKIGDSNEILWGTFRDLKRKYSIPRSSGYVLIAEARCSILLPSRISCPSRSAMMRSICSRLSKRSSLEWANVEKLGAVLEGDSRNRSAQARESADSEDKIVRALSIHQATFFDR